MPAIASDAAAYGTFACDNASTDHEHAPLLRDSSTTAPPMASTPRRSTLARAAGLATALVALILATSCVVSRGPATVPSPLLAADDGAAVLTASKHDHHHQQQQHQHHDGDKPPVADVERQFLEGISTDRLREFLHAYASRPHPAGSAQDYTTALYTAQKFEEFGLRAEIAEYYPLLSMPRRSRVAIVTPTTAARELDLTEATVDNDTCTTAPDALPPFLAYSPSGNVTASVVYVNYGTQADFDWLVAQNVSLAGRIALVRYGRNFRGLKVMLAEQHGMAGALIYSDPRDDGYGAGPVYPHGPWRPRGSFQRGSAQYNSLYAGDPLSPGFAATIDASYLSIEDAKSIPKIPVTALSYDQAALILENLRGAAAPAAWQGGLELANGYMLGDDGAVEVNLDIEMDNARAPIWDVIGTIQGEVEPDQIVLIGNHRDAWVCGAVDPSSGSAAMLEIARNLGELLKSGWRPRRTIKLGSWDGEEYGLLGSTEYAEDHQETLLQKAVAYINVDLTYGPLVVAGGTPSMAQFLYDTAKDVPPNRFFGNETEENLYDQWVAQYAVARPGNPLLEKLTLAPEHLISFLGSGTDFTAFYQHLGILSANLMFSFAAGGSYGTYHSSMDSPMYLETAADPGYTSQLTTAKWWGLLAMRLATLPLLPFDFSTYATVMHKDLSDLEAKTIAMGLEIDYSPLRAAIDHFATTSTTFQRHVEELKTKDSASQAELQEANHKLVRLERQFISKKGLQHRPWFRHVIFGPGFYEGYSGAAFPGIADGIAFRDNATVIQAHVADVAEIVTRAGDFLVDRL